MKSLDRGFLEQQAIPIEMGGLIQVLGEFKGRQDLFRHHSARGLAIKHFIKQERVSSIKKLAVPNGPVR